MQIIVEGPDASGKSTLAAILSDELCLPIKNTEGPEKYWGEIDKRAERYLQYEYPIIFDRHPCVSHPIYSKYTNVSTLRENLREKVYRPGTLFVYCRGGSLDRHKRKEYDSNTHMNKVELHYNEIIRDYDLWGIQHAHMIYRFGESHEPIVTMIRSYWNEVVIGHSPVPREVRA